MDAHSLLELDFDRIRDVLAQCARCSLGKALARELAPSPRFEVVERRLDELRQFQAMVKARGMPPFGGITDVRPLIARAVPPAVLEPSEFSNIAETIRGVASVRRFFDDLPPDQARIADLARRLGDFSPLAQQIDNVIDQRGKVRDDATPRLGRLRRQIEQLRREIQVVFDRLLRQSSVLRLLQYSNATLHGDRMVLPLRADHRGRIAGVIHRSSDSGQTLFIEPTEAVELNNAIIRLGREEAEEVGRVLWELTHALHRTAAPLTATLDTLAVIDLLAAKSQFAVRFGLSVPTVNQEHVLRLRDARHPILLAMGEAERAAGREPGPVVPIDVRLGEDFDLLVVTGPNTGGKTVALKTVGLLALMAQSALPVPAAEGATFPVFDDVLIDIGDEQSLQQSLSTFSAHLARVLDILQRGTRQTLVLIDELGAGTDPDDGAALGRAIVDRLLAIGSLAIVTTHLGALKAVAYECPRVDNAAVQFDYGTLRPTYELRIGEPGNSNALLIAARLGMPLELISAAQTYLQQRDRSLAQAIAGTVESRRAAEKARQAAEAAQREAERRLAESDARHQQLADERERFAGWVERIRLLKPGDEVFVRKFDRKGRVVRVALHKQTVGVSVGSLEVEVPLSEID